MDPHANVEVRPITPDEFLPWLHVNYAGFGGRPSEADIARSRAELEHARSIGAFEGDQVVGAASALTFELTLPGGVVMSVPGVTYVAVSPTHRRRGILSAMMRRQLLDIRSRGESVAILTASESSIYRRFGYGIATSALSFELDRRDAALLAAPEPAGRMRLIAHEVALRVFPEVYERFRRQQPGAISRDATLWGMLLDPQARSGDGAAPYLYAVYEAADGTAEGAVAYRVKQDWANAVPQHTVYLMGNRFIAVHPTARAALWRYCLNLDLTQTVRAVGFSVDEPLRWMLVDSRRMRVTSLRDDLFVRLLDIPAAFAARRYAAEGRVVFEVADPFLPELGGRYELRGGPEGAECRRSSAEPDLALDVADLGAAYLGGVRFYTLWEAGRVAERTPGAVARADTLFRSDAAPFCGTPF